MKRIQYICFLLIFLGWVGCASKKQYTEKQHRSIKEVTEDTLRIEIPDGLSPEKTKRYTEKQAQKRVKEIARLRDEYIRSQGDTSYYVKSEDGRDSTILKISKVMPDVVIRDLEAHVREKMKERLR